MSTRFTSKLIATIILATVTGASFTIPANAGGLFGKHGIIRGSVGSFVEKHVNPVATPILRTATVATGAAAGAVAGGLVGAPEVGGAIGAAVGNGVNQVAAGEKL